MRGQAHTLEAVVAGLMLLSSLVFALQMTAVTPLSASTSSQHIENQQQATGSGVLAAAAQNDSLKPAVLYWNNTSEQFHGTNENLGYYTSGPPNNTLGQMLNRSFDRRGIAYNVYFWFQNEDGDVISRRYIYSGVPSDNAVGASHTITLMDHDHLYDANETRNATVIRDDRDTYPIPNLPSNVYNTVRVEVIAWRI
ncbi:MULTISPECIES: DUF7288 family protein [Haloarcula]|uniref:Uncharacterized protein n=1 Tax=Haloarcula pellucida TaxID=1427151 RepID=A0A830GMZ0_9EURY|nr:MULTISPECIES: hypothetical protein [Halomicroarcula]MBX0348068.1 hypothetical protein [Halomicroarcula pellucida]MDS0277913.1 hypothetical protein [Halomicroarcula sp. S1AR25-4]GGN96758.1 hypothetical protein GCM10009030_25410 [Halomicroarcula pellucida]